MSRKLSHNEFVENLKNINPNVVLLEKYVNSQIKIKVKCLICNHTWYTSPNTLQQGKGCPVCNKGKKAYTHDYFINKFSQLETSKNIEIVGIYTKMKNNIECHCIKCGGYFEKTPASLLLGQGCPICIGKKTVEGINDISTTHSHLIKYFANPDDAKKYTIGSNKRVLFKCPDCGCKKEMQICTFGENGFCCDICYNKGISYPNRFAHSFFSFLDIENYKKEYSPSWIAPKLYDNYFEYNNKKYIVEMDGGFHFKGSFNKSLEEIQKEDKYKDIMAKQHDITIIRIDCRKSDPIYIKNNILNSELSYIFNLETYDWDKCFLAIERNTSYIDIWNYINLNPYVTLDEICNTFKKSKTQICRIIKRGHDLGLCHHVCRNGSKSVNMYIDEKLIKSFSSILQCKKYLVKENIKIGEQKIKDCCDGKILEYKGFVFKYA